MKDILETAKRLGAGIIVLSLVVMMGLTFSSQPMDEILAILGGQTRYGSFDGEDISAESYGYAYGACEERFSQFGKLPAVFLNSCLENTLQELYVLPSIARRLGLEVPPEQVERELVEIAQAEFQRQEVLLEADRRQVEDFYQELVRQGSVKLRSRETSARRLSAAILSADPSPEFIDAAARARASTVSLRMIRFTQTGLLANFDNQVSVSDEELKSEYETWKKEKPDLEPLDKIKGQVMDRVRTKKKQSMLASAKESLGKLKPEDGLQAVTSITGVPAVVSNGVPLEGLSRVQAGGQGVNLASGDFFRDLTAYEPGKKRYFGPYQDGEATVYVEILSVNPRKLNAQEEETLRNEASSRLKQEIYRYLIRTEALRGNFEYRELPEENQQQLDVPQ
ncbi:MAG: hypothetical protein KDK25_05490 [Leptospiraceae bacterium]|nr:hypothetical protein [Leptospiraceae bacterium]